MGRKSDRVTIADVARHAGVSVMTVSRVVNQDAKVRASTRATVEQAIAALNYTPNVAARALAGGTVRRIGLLYGNPSSAYLGDLLIGALEAASEAGVHLVVERTDTAVDIQTIAEQLGRDFDALIVPPPMSDREELRALLRERAFPAVFLASAMETDGLTDIRIDDWQSAFDMTRRLIDLGHTRIGFVKGHPDQTVSDMRFKGYRDALTSAGLTPDDALVAEGRFTYRSGEEAASQLLSNTHRPSAIFASNDDMAAGCLAAAARTGLRVPEDLSIAGFDDSSIASVVWPPLTTLRQPVSDMGAMAVRALVNARGAAVEAGVNIVAHAIVERGSTGPSSLPDTA